MATSLDINYDSKIPNNVDLSNDKRVLKALEKWHPGYIKWWSDLIPKKFQERLGQI